jgi:hypothetical protein
MAPPVRKAISDFPPEVLATQAAHEENISELTARVKSIEELLDTPKKLADFFDEKSSLIGSPVPGIPVALAFHQRHGPPSGIDALAVSVC